MLSMSCFSIDRIWSRFGSERGGAEDIGWDEVTAGRGSVFCMLI